MTADPISSVGSIRRALGEPAHDGSPERAGFVERHGLAQDGQEEAAAHVRRLVDELGIELVRVSFADQHGVLRGKTLGVGAFERALRSGYSAPSTLVAKDTSHRTIVPVFDAHGGDAIGLPQVTGVADIVLVPDATTFRVLPWAPKTGWVLCDLYFPDGTPVPVSSRRIFRHALDEAARLGYDFTVGLEIELYVFRLEDAHLAFEKTGQPAEPPTVSLLAHGYQLMTDNRMDQLDDVVQLIHRGITALDIPVRSIEGEYGPSQLEVTLDLQTGLRAADDMALFRSAVKQICRRHGYHATFMCRPALPNLFSNGWHLHQSLRDRSTGRNAFVSEDPAQPLSATARHYAGGLLAHGRAAAVFSTPTVNGYKRYRPNSLAPDRLSWGFDNKGAMVRAVGGAGDPGTRLENRCGEPAANPYLYMASQLVAGLDGVVHEIDPGPPSDAPYSAGVPRLPATLGEAVEALEADSLYREVFGEEFVRYFAAMKRAEFERYLAAVSDWEHREYFDLF